MPSIWVVDDDASIRFVLEKALQRERWSVRSFEAPSQVLHALRHPEHYGIPEVLISDIRMPDVAGLSGLDLLQKVQQIHPHLPIIIMTAVSDLDSAVSALQGGAFEYLPKPFDVLHAVELVRKAKEKTLSRAANVPNTLQTSSQEMLGQAPAMQEVFRSIGRLANSHATVLISGESGTGKELVARALHRHSPRAQGPFVAINAAAIPRDVLESELFGQENDGLAPRRGWFEQAAGGTLFLDEIGDMPLELQTRLLRVLSDGQFYRLGGQHPIKTDVRIIAATHHDLEERVREGTFREDLFHRLHVIHLRLPALRDRAQDIPLLAQHFMQQCAKELGVEPKRLHPTALQQLSQFAFPGNVRQLENICHWLTVMVPTAVVQSKDLPPEVAASVSPSLIPEIANGKSWQQGLAEQVQGMLQSNQADVWGKVVAECEKILLRTALKTAQQRKTEAALRLGIGRNTITRKLQELGLDEDDA